IWPVAANWVGSRCGEHRVDGDQVMNRRNTWSRPRGLLCFVAFGPRPQRTAKGHLSAGYLHGDSVRVVGSLALKRRLDLFLELGRGNLRLDLDEIGYAFQGREIEHSALRRPG